MKRLSALLPVGLFGGLLLASPVGAEPPRKRPTDEARGKELYDRHCVACHGAWARGHGPATAALVHPVPDLQGKVESNDATIQIVLRGKNAMPGYEQTFDRFDAKRVLDHMGRLQEPTGKGDKGANEPADSPAEPDPEPDEDDGAPPE